MGGPVIHFEIGEKDAARAERFYKDLFGWTFSAPGPGGYRIIGNGADVGIGGGLLPTPPNVAPYVTVYVKVDDLAATLAKAKALGATTLVEPMPIQGVGAFAMFRDPEGNVIGIMKEGT